MIVHYFLLPSIIIVTFLLITLSLLVINKYFPIGNTG